MKFENCKVFNIEGAIRGMRNPKNSWHLSDSYFNIIDDYDEGVLDVADAWIKYFDPDLPFDDDKWKEYSEAQEKWISYLLKNGILSEDKNYQYKEVAFIGPKDMKLAQQLISGGSEHRKFLRQIFISVDITAPLFWFKEFDTYKVATTANSTSTMHKLTSKPITIDCFETGDYDPDLKFCMTEEDPEGFPIKDHIDSTIWFLENLRQKYIETNDKRYWKELVRWLPDGWLQTRTWTADYETLRRIYHQRKDHKLTEWHQFCDFIKTLPYAEELIIID